MKKQTPAFCCMQQMLSRKGTENYICVHTVDTDVVVIVIVMFNQIDPDELWLAFGVGSNLCYMKLLGEWTPGLCCLASLSCSNHRI